MDGKRFGVGVAAGLLVGLAIVASAGSFASLAPTVFAPIQAGGAAVTTTPAIVAVTPQTSTATRSANTTGQPVYMVTSTSTTVAPPNPSGTDSNAQNAAISPLFSSNVASIAHQPLVSNAVILVPLLVAFLLGAILYRASGRTREQPAEA